MKSFLLFLMTVLCMYAEPFSVAVVADVQYADTNPRGDREPREGLPRLEYAISQWNSRALDWGIILGDIIDWDDIQYGEFPQKTVSMEPIRWKHTKQVLEVWNTLQCKRYLVLGNHDYYVPFKDADGMEKPASVFRAFGFKEKAYYEWEHKGFRFVVLDGDVSQYNFPEGTELYKKAKRYYDAVKGPQRTPWSAGISQSQILWLKGVLRDALKQNQPVVVMCHYPIHDPIGGHSLLNSAEMNKVLDGFPNVVLWLNGHNHKGGYEKRGSRHHLNLKGMQNEADNWYEIAFSLDKITVFQAEETETPVYELKMSSW